MHTIFTIGLLMHTTFLISLFFVYVCTIFLVGLFIYTTFLIGLLLVLLAEKPRRKYPKDEDMKCNILAIFLLLQSLWLTRGEALSDMTTPLYESSSLFLTTIDAYNSEDPQSCMNFTFPSSNECNETSMIRNNYKIRESKTGGEYLFIYCTYNYNAM